MSLYEKFGLDIYTEEQREISQQIIEKHLKGLTYSEIEGILELLKYYLAQKVLN